jgi:energy-coupling factor transport system substrate-specific component
LSWQITTFVLLGAVLVGGFAWYERSRPPARLVALVAALAALAVAGRLVLTPFPNVVATTDIALITGYALGAAPGFAVGALAAPVSNIWLGQGPWTAWEMAGWGLVGLAGAWVAVLSGRRLNRFGLAAVCGLAGLAYGALLDYSVMATYGGEQSLDRYLALSARGVPFNVAHMAGNVAIALAAGPALVGMISRFRSRLEFSWRPAGAAPLAALAVCAVLAAGALGPPAADAKRSTPTAWLSGSQNDDGGFAAARGQPSSPAMTGWAMLGLEAAGRNPLDLNSGGETPVTYLRAEVDRLRSVGDLERTILALEGAGIDPHRFAGQDLVAELRQRRSADGSVDGQVNLTAFYLLALRAAGVDAARLGRPARWLRQAQGRNGGWGIQPEAPSEADSTGAVLQALAVAGGGNGGALEAGARFLRRSQASGGGFALAGTGVVNAQSTAWAVQGLTASGSGGPAIADASDYLASVRASDGHYRYSASSDQTPVWVTAQALLAVERAPFPLAAVARAAKPEPAPQAEPSPSSAPASEQTGTGGGPPQRHRTHPVEKTSNNDTKSTDSQEPVASSTDTESESTASEPPTLTAPPAPAAAADDEDTSSSAPYVIAGLAALAAALGAGFVWYRRRLP